MEGFQDVTTYLDNVGFINYFNVMTDHKEEQEHELEALNSIYPDEFSSEYKTSIRNISILYLTVCFASNYIYRIFK